MLKFNWRRPLLLKTMMLGFTGVIINKGFAQEDSLVQNHQAETLWYLQKETWVGGSILILLILIGVLFRLAKLNKRPAKRITTTRETIIASDPSERPTEFNNIDDAKH